MYFDKVIYHPVNPGKGAVIRTGFTFAGGDVLIVQDADLEYEPQEYSLMIDPILNSKADVVFGSRFMGGKHHRVVYYWHMLRNRFLTTLSNMFTNINLADIIYEIVPGASAIRVVSRIWTIAYFYVLVTKRICLDSALKFPIGLNQSASILPSMYI